MDRKNKQYSCGKNKLILLVAILISLVLFSYFIFYLVDKINFDLKDKIAVIKLEGIIGGTDEFGSNGINTDSIISYIENAEKDDSIKGIIIDINSPGGSVLPSEMIASAVKKIKKPKIALIRDVGASGAYWVASACDDIVAYPMSVTGSIGVRGSYLEFSGLMEKYGVTYNSLTAGKYKDTGSPYKDLTNEEEFILMDTINKIYDYFVEQVAINRNMSKEDIKKLADGYIMLGEDAKEKGLIDYVGDENFAINLVKEKAGIKDAKLVYYREQTSIFDLFSKISAKSFYFLGKGIGSSLFSLNNNNFKITT